MTAPTSREAPNPSHVMLELRHAFDGENVAVKNVMLRKAHDCIERLLSVAQTPNIDRAALQLFTLDNPASKWPSVNQEQYRREARSILDAALSPMSSTEREYHPGEGVSLPSKSLCGK
jgi:hypothetical protein